jgi:MATE family multidrug resistance protein
MDRASLSIASPYASARKITVSAFPIYVTMMAGLVGSIIVTGSLGRHATFSLAAFMLVTSVANPAGAAISGVLRGVMPFIAPNRDDADALIPILRDARWVALIIGAAGAALVAGTPVLAQAAGVDTAVIDELGGFPLLMAMSVLIDAFGGGANTALIALGRSKQVLWSGLARTMVLVILTPPAVSGLFGLPPAGLTGAGVVAVLGSLTSVVIANVCIAKSPIMAGRMIGYQRPHLTSIMQFTRVGIPIAATLVVKFLLLSVVAFAIARVSAQAAAAHGVLNTLAGLMFTSAMAVGMAAVPEIARATAGGQKSVRTTGVSALTVAAISAVLAALVLAFNAHWVVGLFSHDDGVVQQVMALVPILLLVGVADGCQAAVGAALNGLKQTLPSLLLFAIAYGLLAVLSIGIANAAGLAGIWWALCGVTVFLSIGQCAAFLRYSSRIKQPS